MTQWIRLSFIIALSLVTRHAQAADEVFDSKGVKIHYITAGQGEPIVLLHGWMSDAASWGRLEKNPASKEYQLIAVDLRGHGKSDKPHNVEQYGQEMAEDVIRLLDHLKLPRVHLLGYSMGAIVAGKIAATHPDRVLSIVYGGQAPILTGKNKADAREIEVFAKLVDEGKDLGQYLLEFMPTGKEKLTPEMAKLLATVGYSGKDVKAFAAAGRGIKHLDVTLEQLGQCKAPFLFLHGSREAEDTKQRARHIVKALGRGEVIEIDGADHLTTLPHPKFGKAVNEFLRSHQQK